MEPERLGQRLGQGGLPYSWGVFNQQMTSRTETRQGQADHLELAVEDRAHIGGHGLQFVRQGLGGSPHSVAAG